MDQEQAQRAYEAGVEIHKQAGAVHEQFHQTMAICGPLISDIYHIFNANQPPTDEQLEQLSRRIVLAETWAGLLAARATQMQDAVSAFAGIMEGGP